MKEKRKNRTLFIGDNLDVLRQMDRDSVDMIYLDPPFNSGKNYQGVVGSNSENYGFKDKWTVDDAQIEWWEDVAEIYPDIYNFIGITQRSHSKRMAIYLLALTMRLIELHRILQANGSIYLHCDCSASHYIKVLLDAIFGRERFKEEVIWKRMSGAKTNANRWGTVTDSILFYAGDYPTWNNFYLPYSKDEIKRHFNKEDRRGRYKLYAPVGPSISKKISRKDAGCRRPSFLLCCRSPLHTPDREIERKRVSYQFFHLWLDLIPPRIKSFVPFSRKQINARRRGHSAQKFIKIRRLF